MSSEELEQLTQEITRRVLAGLLPALTGAAGVAEVAEDMKYLASLPPAERKEKLRVMRRAA